MTLKEYLESDQVSLRSFAAKIGRSHTTVSFLAKNPKSVRLIDARNIENVTGGKVTLSDW